MITNEGGLLIVKKRLISLTRLLIVLVIGVFIGKILYDKPVKTLSITTYGEDCGANICNIQKITDNNSLGEGFIDDILMLLITSTQIGSIDLFNNIPDYSFRIFSLQSDYTLTMGDVWFLDDETSIIGVANYDTNTIMNAIKLDQRQTLLLKQVINAI